MGEADNGVGVGADAISLLLLSDSDQRILEYGCSYHTMYIYVVSNFCLSLYLHVAGV